MKFPRVILAAVIAFAGTLAVTVAQAKVFDFSYTTVAGGFLTSEGSGQFTAFPDGSNYLVTGASGTVDGLAISLIAPNGFAGNDNLLIPVVLPGATVDFAGVSFETTAANYNLFVGNGFPSWISNGATAICTVCSGNNETAVNLTITAVPEASTWAMMLLGFAGLGFAGYRRIGKQRLVGFAA